VGVVEKIWAWMVGNKTSEGFKKTSNKKDACRVILLRGGQAEEDYDGS